MARKYAKMPQDDEVLQLLREDVLVSSAVTLMPDDYIRKSVVEYMTTHMLFKLGLIKVNEDAESLSKSMLFSSLEGQRDSYLNQCVVRALAPEIFAPDAERTSEQKRQDKLAEEMSFCSFENLITQVKNNQGQSRVTLFFDKPTPGSKKTNPANLLRYIAVEKPVEFNFKKLNIDALTTLEELDTFTKNVLEYEAGNTMTLSISINLFDPVVKTLVKKLIGWQELALEECRNSHHNVKPTAVADPWAKLFGGL